LGYLYIFESIKNIFWLTAASAHQISRYGRTDSVPVTRKLRMERKSLSETLVGCKYWKPLSAQGHTVKLCMIENF